MVAFELIPKTSIGPFALGATQAAIRAAAKSVGYPLRTQHGRSDYFGSDVSFQVEYDEGGRAWFIGANRETNRHQLLFEGRDLFATDARQVFELFCEHEFGTKPAYNPQGVTFPTLIVTLWEADDWGAPEPVWGQIGIGSESYWQAVQMIQSR